MSEDKDAGGAHAARLARLERDLVLAREELRGGREDLLAELGWEEMWGPVATIGRLRLLLREALRALPPDTAEAGAREAGAREGGIREGGIRETAGLHENDEGRRDLRLRIEAVLDEQGPYGMLLEWEAATALGTLLPEREPPEGLGENGA